MDLFQIWCVALYRGDVCCKWFWLLSNINFLYESSTRSTTVSAQDSACNFILIFFLFCLALMYILFSAYTSTCIHIEDTYVLTNLTYMCLWIYDGYAGPGMYRSCWSIIKQLSTLESSIILIPLKKESNISFYCVELVLHMSQIFKHSW